MSKRDVRGDTRGITVVLVIIMLFMLAFLAGEVSALSDIVKKQNMVIEELAQQVNYNAESVNTLLAKEPPVPEPVVVAVAAVEEPAMQYSEQEILMLATIIDNEARNQRYEGKLAVGAVVMNRVNSDLFPNTIEAVILAPNQFCKLRYLGDQLLDDSMAAALAALSGEDPTGGALFFYNPKLATSKWGMSRPATVTIQDHVFTL